MSLRIPLTGVSPHLRQRATLIRPLRQIAKADGSLCPALNTSLHNRINSGCARSLIPHCLAPALR